MLMLPNFQLEFTMDTDASGFGVGAVLQQQGRPLAFFSKALGARHQALSIVAIVASSESCSVGD